MIRLFYLLWIVVFFALSFAAVADTLFGEGPLARRINDLIPRVAVSLVWPLALVTPRGRYLLWRRWRPTR